MEDLHVDLVDGFAGFIAGRCVTRLLKLNSIPKLFRGWIRVILDGGDYAGFNGETRTVFQVHE